MTCLVFISSMRIRTFYYTNRTSSSLRNGIFLYPLEFQNLFYLRFSSAFDDKGFYVSNCVLYTTSIKQLVFPSKQYIQKRSYIQFFSFFFLFFFLQQWPTEFNFWCQCNNLGKDYFHEMKEEELLVKKGCNKHC